MSAPTTLARIALVFDQLGAGMPDEELKRVMFRQLAEDFNQLSLDLAAEPGWTAATGTATKGGFNTGTVTLPNLAQSVKAIIDMLLSKGTVGP